MIDRCSHCITAWLIRYEAVKETDRELYEYAVHSLILMLVPLMLSVLFGCIMGCTSGAIVMILPFMIIRKFSGGYHAKRARNCLISSCLVILCCIYVAGKLEIGLPLSCLLGLASTSLIICSPIDHENRRLDAGERCSYKRMTAVLTILFLALYVVLGWLKLETYAVCIAVGLILSAALQMPCVVQKIMKIE